MKIRFDQHIMVDKAIIRKIAELGEIKPNDRILEIGAGSGGLTKELARKCRHVVAVEIDKKYAAELRKIKGVKPVIGNALKEIDGIEFDKLVANIPYAICEPLMNMLFGREFRLAILTIPKGFAEMLVSAKPESKMGLMVQVFFDVRVLMDVPREAFEPEPKTDSVVVRIVQKAGNSLQKEVMKRQKLKTKNAIMRGLFTARKLAKKEAKKAIKTLKLNNNLLEKRLFEADLEELDAVLESLEKLKIPKNTDKDL
jgi:16S rRNA (adenine1518-N6/adenine1519-N6)-dimethyltransferase